MAGSSRPNQPKFLTDETTDPRDALPPIMPGRAYPTPPRTERRPDPTPTPNPAVPSTDPAVASMARDLASMRKTASFFQTLVILALIVVFGPPLALVAIFGLACIAAPVTKPFADRAKLEELVAEAKADRDKLLDSMEKHGFSNGAFAEPDGRQALVVTDDFQSLPKATRETLLRPIWRLDEVIGGDGRTIELYEEVGSQRSKVGSYSEETGLTTIR